ncbi:MAG: CAP domain-containing protein [Solirubrobacteraceae bacterium]|nr:CAP domain-containing protein [Solirubrobacteraceae bacterium]
MSRTIMTATIVALLLACTLGTASAGAASPCARASTPPTSSTLTQASVSILCLVNRERRSRGLRSVRTSRALTSAARAHTRDMIVRGFFAHVDPDGVTPRRRAARAGYAGGAAKALIEEALAFGTAQLSTPRRLVRMLMADPHHRRTLLGRHWRHIGIGIAIGAPGLDVPGRGATLTLNFGRP